MPCREEGPLKAKGDNPNRKISLLGGLDGAPSPRFGAVDQCFSTAGSRPTTGPWH
jgi:hypothetical protein